MTIRVRFFAYLLAQCLLVLGCILALHLPLPAPAARYAIPTATLQTAAGTEAIRLPYHVPPDAFGGGPLDLDLTFERPQEPSGPWAVMLPRFVRAVEVRVNNALVLDSRNNNVLDRPDRNAAELAPIPGMLLHAGTNTLTVRLHGHRLLDGFLDRVYVGPVDALRPAYQARVMVFQTLPVVFSAWQAILAILLGVVWLKRRGETSYGMLAAAMLVGVGQTFTAPPDTAAFPALNAVLIASPPLEAACVLVFVLAFLGLKRPPYVWAAFLPALLIAVVGLTGDPHAVLRAFVAVGLPTVILTLAAIVVLTGYVTIRRGDATAALLGCATTILLSFGIHDTLLVLNIAAPPPVFVARLSYSALLVAIGVGLIWRFATALNEVDGFAGRMVVLVRETEEKLRKSLALEEERSRAAALATERTRLMRDLHDGLGGQLVSIVALSERPAWEGARVGEAARAALRDLRLVIDAMDDIDGDLMLALGSWRERTVAQLRPHGLTLEWRVPAPQGLPVHPELRPWQVIQILRLLDEAVTNAVKHAGASRIAVTIEAAVDDETAGRITVEDDGCGFRAEGAASATPGAGRGLSNIRRRAARCGARVSIRSGPGAGTAVRLDLPRVFPDVEMPV